MVTVWIPALLRNFTQGRESVQVAGTTVRQIIDYLEVQAPGIKNRLCAGDELRPSISVAINSQVTQGGLAQAVPDNSEVHFVLAISGG
jgi:molybdopterin synthase sulfur carrier subunit